MRTLRAALSALALLYAIASVMPEQAVGQTPALTVSDRGAKRNYTRQDMLSRPDLHSITISDPVYLRPMTYRAIPASALLQGL